jgi:hypothetical protein
MSLFAQYPTTQLLLKDVPQSKYYNAGFFPEYSGHFGFPMLSNISATASSSGFAMKDLFSNKNTLNLDGFVDGLEDKNFLNTGIGIDILSFGFKIKKNYFSLNITPKVDVNFGYNKNLLGFIIKGNGDFVGKTMYFDGTGFDISAYNEIGLGYAREVNEKLSLGGRLKLLTGIGNVSGNFDGVSLYTDEDDFSITANSTFTINQYGKHLINDSVAQAWGAPTINPSSLGAGIDFGAAYKVSDELNVFASVVDLGYLSWKDYGEQLYNDGASFTFGGFPFHKIQSNDSTEGDFFTELADSLNDIFSLKKERTSYTTSLKTKIFAGANYKINKYFDADGIIHGRFFGSKFYPSVMLGVGANVGSWFRLKLSYAATNGSYDNIGAAAVFNLGAFQIYGAMDNLYGITQVDYAKNITGSFGINFVFRKDKDEKKIKKRKKESNSSDKVDQPKTDATPKPKAEAAAETPVVKEETASRKPEVKSKAAIISTNDSVNSSTDSSIITAVEKPITVDSSAVIPVAKETGEPVTPAQTDSTLSSTVLPASITELIEQEKDSLVTPVKEINESLLKSLVDSVNTSALIKGL